MSKQLTSLSLAFFFVIFVSFVGQSYSQTSTATLSGVVQDEKGAVIAGASVSVIDPARGLKRDVTTNSEGQFSVPLLPPSTYNVIVEQTGFAKMLVEDVVLNVTENRSLAIQMQIKQTEEVVTVDADAISVRTDGNGMGTVIDREFVGQLPNNGRSFSTLVLLSPGVTIAPATNLDLGQFSVNGMRASSNSVSVDGVSANIAMPSVATSLAIAGAYPGTSAMGGTNNLVSQDALQEFKIQTSGYGADSGRQPGAQVQVVTRSGTNDLTFSLFEYFRNEALDARNYFNPVTQPKAALRQNQYGGTVGGPVFLPAFGDGGPRLYNGKNKTFFFFSYEAQRLMLPTSGEIGVPSARYRALANTVFRPFMDAFPTQTGPDYTMACQQPPAPAPPDPTCVNNRRLTGGAPYNYSVSNPSDLTSTSIRIDHALSGKHSIFGRFNEAPSYAASGVYSKSRSNVNTRTLTMGSTWLFTPKFTNEFRFNISRQVGSSESYFVPTGGGLDFPLDPLTNGFPGTSSLTFRFSDAITAALNTGLRNTNIGRTMNIIDNVMFTKGGHQFKFGVDLRRMNPVYASKFAATTTSVPNETSLAAGRVSYSVSAFQEALPQFDNWSLYGSDSWKATKRLTLDIGLRWEFNPVPTEAEGRLPGFVGGIVDGDVSGAYRVPPGTLALKPYYKAFSPRIGAAYQLYSGAGRETVIRGGFGVYYDLGNGAAAAYWPFGASKSLANILFPVSPENAARPTTFSGGSASTGHNPDLKPPYSLQWNLGVEQAISKGQVISVAYVASAGRDLIASQTLNQQPIDAATGQLLPRPNPNFQSIGYTYNGPTSDFHSMQAQYRIRLKNRIQAIANYTWSHAIDYVSTELQNGGGQNVLDRGNASFDVRHNFSAAVHYDIPQLKWGAFLALLTRGWSLDAIVHAQSGFPVDVTAGSALVIEGIELRVRPDYIAGQPLYVDDPSVPGGRRFNVAAFRSPAECVPAGAANCTPRIVRQGNLGRNVLRALPITQFDVSLSRNFRLRERLNLLLKGEAFNVLNHPMFGNYRPAFTVPSTFGVPSMTLSRGLGGMNHLYQLGGPRSIQLSARLTF